MASRDDTGRGAPVVGDTIPAGAAAPVPGGAEVAPGVVLDPEMGQPMAVEPGASPPPTAPPEMLGLPGEGGQAPAARGEVPAMEQPDDLQGPPS